MNKHQLNFNNIREKQQRCAIEKESIIDLHSVCTTKCYLRKHFGSTFLYHDQYIRLTILEYSSLFRIIWWNTLSNNEAIIIEIYVLMIICIAEHWNSGYKWLQEWNPSDSATRNRCRWGNELCFKWGKSCKNVKLFKRLNVYWNKNICV